MSSHTQEVRRPTIDDFMTLFICGLVLRGKRVIWIRRTEAVEERSRMYALHKHLNEVCAQAAEENRDRLHFLLRLRSELSLGLIGSFDGFRHQVASKMDTIVSVELPYCHTYNLDVQPVTARSMMETAEPWMRELVEKAVEVYMAKVP